MSSKKFNGYFSISSYSSFCFFLNARTSDDVQQLQRSHQPSCGPNRCKIAPKKHIEVKKENRMVEQITKANFWNVIICPPNRARPARKVVTVPLKILTPIS